MHQSEKENQTKIQQNTQSTIKCKYRELDALKHFITANKSPGWECCIGNLCVFKEELTPILLKLFKDIEDEKTFLNLFF